MPLRTSEYVRIKDHTIWAVPVKSGAVVLDCGAHKGGFSRIMRAHFGASCFLVEANAELARPLHDEFPNVLSGAAWGKDGLLGFVPDQNPEAGRVAEFRSDRAENQVKAYSLESIVEWAGAEFIDVLKLDIEGSEFDVLRSLSVELARKIGQITVEFHHSLNQPGTGNGVRQTVMYLRGLGFDGLRGSATTFGDYLFVNRNRYPARSAIFDPIAPVVFGLTGLRRNLT